MKERSIYILSSTDRLFCCITTLQCVKTCWILLTGFKTHLTLH